MADGGCGGPTAPSSSTTTTSSSSSSSSSSSPLDGAFLLQLLRNPPQSQQQPQQQYHQQKPLAFLPHETLNPYRDHAVASVGPATTYPFASHHHSSFRVPPQDIQFSTPLPSSSPPGFSSRAPPGFAGSPPVYRGDFFIGNSSTNHQSGGGRNLDSLKDRGRGNANGNYADSSYWHKVNSAQTQSHTVSNQRRGLSQNVHYDRREGNSQPSLHLQQREFIGIHGGSGQQQRNRHYDQYGGGFGRKDGLVEEFERGRSSEDPSDDFGGRKGGRKSGFRHDLDDLHEQLEESLMVGEDDSETNVAKNSNHLKSKDVRLDLFRGHNVSSQRARIRKRELKCRYDIDNLTPLFLAIYRSLIPADEEIEKQKQLLLSLGKLVNKEWPNARLHLYGSCANLFGVSNSDIDLCLAIDPADTSKAEILLKLADILQSGNLQNVQALTRARVPIVKMMDPVTGISCDICINNLLAVANTKLLRDYAQIDDRLRQLAFMVKHWAKSRGVNETYRGTLSSYAYVLMCIHFLQQRKPAILPCLQEMEPTYVVDVDGIRCAYFDQIDRLRNVGTQNNESVARLLWGFFHYWAYYHDYTNDVISVRTGQTISKPAKDWTRRIGNDRHLICIEDPFETSHDLGRVVDKFSIKILREEFERAADIMQYDANPCVTLFEPYVQRSLPNGLQSEH